jgi:hypothetical protein
MDATDKAERMIRRRGSRGARTAMAMGVEDPAAQDGSAGGRRQEVLF